MRRFVRAFVSHQLLHNAEVQCHTRTDPLLEKQHYRPLAPDVWCCVHIVILGTSEQKHDFLQKRLSMSWSVVAKIHCEWCCCFRAMRLCESVFINHLYPSPFAHWAAAYTLTHLAGLLADVLPYLTLSLACRQIGPLGYQGCDGIDLRAPGAFESSAKII